MRNNSVYGIGVFMQRCSAEVAAGFYAPCLQALSALLSVENKRFVVDNILGAVSRMILAHHQLIPNIDQVCLKQVVENLKIYSNKIFVYKRCKL